METSWNVYDYPEPPEEKTKRIKAQVFMSFSVEEEVPTDWDNDKIKEYIKDNIDCYYRFNEVIEEIEI